MTGSSSVASLLLIWFLLSSCFPPGTKPDLTGGTLDHNCEQSSQRTISLSAEDQQGRLVDNLRVDDLTLTENKAPREILKLERKTNEPLSVAILIDTSASQERSLPRTKLAALRFVQSILRKDTDRAALVSFTGIATVEQELTNDVTKLRTAIDRVRFVPPPGYVSGIIVSQGPPNRALLLPGATAIWDAVWATIDGMFQSDTGSRRVIVLLTDGEDTISKTKMRTAIEYASTHDVAVFSVGISDDKNYGINRDNLNKMSEETGGRAFFPKRLDDIDGTLVEAEQLLRSQYLLTYCRSNQSSGKSVRKIKIEIRNPQSLPAMLRFSYCHYGL
ncbi:MAG: VWA domain-containing protein [Acidobacteriota bacterium]|nr:VWA domain-containing protein [Acidobacteriota bacterium]